MSTVQEIGAAIEHLNERDQIRLLHDLSAHLKIHPDDIAWLKTAAVEKGSWWRPWTEWLIARSGIERPARKTLGNRQYPPLGPAPGTYVSE